MSNQQRAAEVAERSALRGEKFLIKQIADALDAAEARGLGQAVAVEDLRDLAHEVASAARAWREVDPDRMLTMQEIARRIRAALHVPEQE